MIGRANAAAACSVYLQNILTEGRGFQILDPLFVFLILKLGLSDARRGAYVPT